MTKRLHLGGSVHGIPHSRPSPSGSCSARDGRRRTGAPPAPRCSLSRARGRASQPSAASSRATHTSSSRQRRRARGGARRVARGERRVRRAAPQPAPPRARAPRVPPGHDAVRRPRERQAAPGEAALADSLPLSVWSVCCRTVVLSLPCLVEWVLAGVGGVGHISACRASGWGVGHTSACRGARSVTPAHAAPLGGRSHQCMPRLWGVGHMLIRPTPQSRDMRATCARVEVADPPPARARRVIPWAPSRRHTHKRSRTHSIVRSTYVVVVVVVVQSAELLTSRLGAGDDERGGPRASVAAGNVMSCNAM